MGWILGGGLRVYGTHCWGMGELEGWSGGGTRKWHGVEKELGEGLAEVMKVFQGYENRLI